MFDVASSELMLVVLVALLVIGPKDLPRVLRVVALSGGFKRPEACVELSKNRGIIASFSRALLEDLRAQMSDAEFDASLGCAIDEIYTASTVKS